jgi:tetratricopeptide (TPR) repeat protein
MERGHVSVRKQSEQGCDEWPIGFAQTAIPFVGRRQQLDALGRCLEDARGGRPQVALIQGEAGVGKTRFLKEVRSSALRHGLEVCSGRCYEDLALPYLPFFESLLSRLGPVLEEVKPAFSADAEIIDRLLHPGGESILAANTALSAQVDQEKLRLLLAVSRATIKLAQSHPLLLFVDDLHWADQPSLDLFSHLVFAVVDAAVREPVPLLIIGAYRPVEPQERLARVLDRFQREDICQTLELSGLSEEEVNEFIQGLGLARPSHQLVVTVNKATQGNPLFIQEVLHHLVKQGALEERAGYVVTTAASPDLRLPEQITAAIAARTQGISERCRGTLTLASFLGESFSLQVLSVVSGMREDELLDLLEEGMRQRLVLGEGHTVQFAHPLIRHVFYTAPSAVRRQRIHQQIARSLEHLYADKSEDHLLEIAHHLVHAGSAAEAEKIVEYARRAGDQAFSVCAWSEAAHYYEAALSAATATDRFSAHDRAELHYLTGLAHYRDMDAGPCLDHYEKAIEAYRLTGDMRGLAQVLKDKVYVYFTLASVPYGTLIDLGPLEETVEALGDTELGLRGHIWAVIAKAYWTARQPDQTEAAARRALEIGQHLEDDVLCADASVALALAYSQSLHLHEELENWRNSLVSAQRANDLWRQGLSLQRIPMPLTGLGRLDEAEAVALEACQLIRETHDWGGYSMALADLVFVDVAKGDFVAAEKHAYEALLMVQRSRYPWGGALALPTLACARALRGAWAEAEEAIDMLVEPGRIFAEVGPAVQILAWVYRQLLRARSGTADDALDLFAAEMLRIGGSDIHALAGFCALVEIGSLVAAPALAESAYRALSLAVERDVIFSSGWVFLIPRVLGVAAALNHWWDKAETHFHTALETAKNIGARPELGRSCLDYARMLVARGAQGDRPRAVDLVGQAGLIFSELGMEPFTQQTVQFAEALDISIPVASRQLTTSPNDLSRSTETTPPSDHATFDDALRGTLRDEPVAADNVFRWESEYWTIAYRGTVCRLKDAKGLHYIAFLLRYPGREFHTIELVTTVGKRQRPATTTPDAVQSKDQLTAHYLSVRGVGDAGTLLDAQAKAAYKRRLDDLREELEEAQRFNDLERITQAQAEIDFLTEELAAAVGLGGRARKAAAAAERARLNVTKSIKAALRTIRENHSPLGQHLATSIRTGTFCSYAPDPTRPLSWIL